MFRLPSRIARMPRRRQKIAVRRMMENELQQFVGEPNSPLVRAQVTGVIAEKFGMGVRVTAQPFPAVEYITINIGK